MKIKIMIMVSVMFAMPLFGAHSELQYKRNLLKKEIRSSKPDLKKILELIQDKNNLAGEGAPALQVAWNEMYRHQDDTIRQTIVRELIKHGAAEIPFMDGNLPLDHAFEDPVYDLFASLLIKNGINPNTQLRNGHFPLHAAVQNKKPAIVELLLEHGADVSLPNAQGKTAQEYIREGRDPRLMEIKKIFSEKPKQIAEKEAINIALSQSLPKELIDIVTEFRPITYTESGSERKKGSELVAGSIQEQANKLLAEANDLLKKSVRRSREKVIVLNEANVKEIGDDVARRLFDTIKKLYYRRMGIDTVPPTIDELSKEAYLGRILDYILMLLKLKTFPQEFDAADLEQIRTFNGLIKKYFSE